MKIKKITSIPFTARITLGTQIGYTVEKISKRDLIAFIQDYQNNLIQSKNLFLSVCLNDCEIVLSGQVEPHFQLSFINYPKFPLDEEILKEEIEEFSKGLMSRFLQNRIAVEFPHETIMFEQSEKTDPRIRK